MNRRKSASEIVGRFALTLTVLVVAGVVLGMMVENGAHPAVNFLILVFMVFLGLTLVAWFQRTLDRCVVPEYVLVMRETSVPTKPEATGSEKDAGCEK